MEIRDYLRMLRRGWPAVVLVTTFFVGIAAAYLALAPKRYDATTVLFVSTANPKSISDLQSGCAVLRRPRPSPTPRSSTRSPCSDPSASGCDPR